MSVYNALSGWNILEFQIPLIRTGKAKEQSIGQRQHVPQGVHTCRSCRSAPPMPAGRHRHRGIVLSPPLCRIGTLAFSWRVPCFRPVADSVLMLQGVDGSTAPARTLLSCCGPNQSTFTFPDRFAARGDGFADDPDGEWSGEFFVKGEEEFDAFAVGGERFGAVAGVDGSVEVGVGLRQVRGHRQRIVQVRQARPRTRRPRVQHRLGLRFHVGFLLRRRRLGPGVVVVDESCRVAVVRFQAAADQPNPCHVHCRRQNTEVKSRDVGVDETEVADHRLGFHEADWNVPAAFGRDFWNDDETLFWHVLDVEPCWRRCELLRRCAFAGEPETANGFDSFHHFGHLPQFAWFAFAEPQSPTFPSVQKLGGAEPAPKQRFRLWLFANELISLLGRE